MSVVLASLRAGGYDPRTTSYDAWDARCPVHKGHHRSLTIKKNQDGSVLVCCHRIDPDGHICSPAEIVGGLGLTLRQLFPAISKPAPIPVPPQEPGPEIGGNGLGEKTGGLSAAANDVAENTAGLSAAANDVGAQDRATSAGERKPREEGEAAARMLLRLAARAKLLQAPDGRLYAIAPVRDRHDCHELRSRGFRRWLNRLYRSETGKIPPAEVIKNVVACLEADAEHEGAVEAPCLRAGAAGGSTRTSELPTYYLDLGDHTRRAIAIKARGWELVDQPPVHFRRPDGMGPLPTPVRGGSIDRLEKYVNVTAEQFPLLIAWLTAALLPVGPYPVLNLIGEQGSAKSTLARVARRLIDPHASPLRAEPANRRDLMVGALNNWVLAFDNVTAIPGWLSDDLCRLATGGSFAARRLFDNDQEHHWSAQRPVIVNGITELACKPDLLDRSLFLELPPILDSERQYEQDLWAAFEADYPRILGALLDLAAGALHWLPIVELSSRPRMADFARWGEAVCQAIGYPRDTFLAAYLDDRRAASYSALDDSPVARAVQLIARSGRWSGTATELLQELTRAIGGSGAAVRNWPKSPRWLSSELRRVAPQLRLAGVFVTFDVVHGVRRITIERHERPGEAPSLPVDSISVLAGPREEAARLSS